MAKEGIDCQEACIMLKQNGKKYPNWKLGWGILLSPAYLIILI